MTNKAAMNLLFLLLISFASTGIMANGNTQIWDSAEQAAEHHQVVKNKTRNYLRDGFELTDAFANAYRYTVPPTGDFDWGVYLIHLKKVSDGLSLETTYVTITVYVRYLEGADGYKVTGFDIHEETVF